MVAHGEQRGRMVAHSEQRGRMVAHDEETGKIVTKVKRMVEWLFYYQMILPEARNCRVGHYGAMDGRMIALQPYCS